MDPTDKDCNNDAIAQVVEEVIRRRWDGEHVDDAEVIAAHPGLMPKLGERLSDLSNAGAGKHLGFQRRSTQVNDDNALVTTTKSALDAPCEETVPVSKARVRRHLPMIAGLKGTCVSTDV